MSEIGYVGEKQDTHTKFHFKEIIMDEHLKKAQAFAEANTFRFQEKELKKRKSRCVDGGYRADQVKDSFARPGADGGYVEALLKVAKDKGVEISGKQGVEVVKKVVESFGRGFNNHTDMHAEHDNHEAHAEHKKIGCGHEAKAVDFAEEYGVNALVMQEAIDAMVTEVENTVLDREHTEDSVLIVHGNEYSLNPWNSDRSEMNFIYDVDVDAEVMNLIWQGITQELPALAGVKLSLFKEAADLQTGITVEKLATSKGKPTFHVRYDRFGKPTVSGS